jgi:putative endonuclease
MASRGTVNRRTKTRKIGGCYVYVLAALRRGRTTTYVGWTTDLDARLTKHNTGKGAKATRGGAWQLLYAERYRTRAPAMAREWAIKHDRRFRDVLRGTASEAFA